MAVGGLDDVCAIVFFFDFVKTFFRLEPADVGFHDNSNGEARCNVVEACRLELGADVFPHLFFIAGKLFSGRCFWRNHITTSRVVIFRHG